MALRALTPIQDTRPTPHCPPSNAPVRRPQRVRPCRLGDSMSTAGAHRPGSPMPCWPRFPQNKRQSLHLPHLRRQGTGCARLTDTPKAQLTRSLGRRLPGASARPTGMCDGPGGIPCWKAPGHVWADASRQARRRGQSREPVEGAVEGARRGRRSMKQPSRIRPDDAPEVIVSGRSRQAEGRLAPDAG